MTAHVLVTGSSGGIGAAACRRFTAAGWKVTGVDRQPPPDRAAWTHLSIDLSEPGAGTTAVAEAGADAPLHAIVHAAAVQVVGAAGHIDRDDWRRTLQVNVLVLDEMVGAAETQLRAHRGSVVAIGSVHASATTREMAAYATSKAALAGWVRAAALDLAPDVRVNGVAPGAVDTAMLAAGLRRRPEDGAAGEALARLAARTPLGVVARPEAIAELVWVLADPATASFVTGTMVVADGGALVRLGTE
jgi:NAD(P)-dependent dehydrogenase (short-subunit alcohol dehydrogenase family)